MDSYAYLLYFTKAGKLRLAPHPIIILRFTGKFLVWLVTIF